MKLAYVAGPYRASSERELVMNIRRAEDVATKLWRMGYAVICPHKNSGHLGGIVDDEVFLAGAIEMMKKCDLVVLVRPWNSQGTLAEMKVANELNIPLYTINPEQGWLEQVGWHSNGWTIKPVDYFCEKGC